MDVKEGYRGGPLGSSGEYDVKEHVPRDRHQANREVQDGKGFKGPGRENINNYGQQVLSVRTPQAFVRKSTWQAADVRRPLVSASHIIQDGNDLFVGKDEAYVTNMRKEKSILRNEGNVSVLDLFVRVPPRLTAPVTFTPMEVDAINQVADGRQRGKRVTFSRNSSTFDVRKSARGKQVQASWSRMTTTG